MAEQSGFFPDVNGDREYTCDFLAKWVASFLSNGTYDGELAVNADGSGMSVTLSCGRAWINGYYYRGDGDLALAIDNADGVLNRKDIVVLRWDINARNITAQVIKGTPAGTAAAPAITRSAEQYDLKLAEISIPAGTTAITQSLITDTRLDTEVCGIVHAVVDHIDTSTFYNQIQSDLAEFKATNEAGFTAWAAGLKDILDDETAGNLLNLINDHKADQTVHVTTLACTKTDTVYALTGLSASSGLISCVFKADADYAERDTFTVNGTAVTAQLQNGESLPDEFFKAGATVPFIYDAENAKLNFKQSGGAKLNLFVQPDEPENKNGLWIEAPEKHTVNRITDKNSFTIGGEIRTYDSSLNVGSLFATISDSDRTVILSYNGDIYQIRGNKMNDVLYLNIYRWNHSTNTTSDVYSHSSTMSGKASTQNISSVIACISGTTLYAAVSTSYGPIKATIICRFNLISQTGTTTLESLTQDLLTGYSGESEIDPSGQIGYQGTKVYFIFKERGSTYYTRLYSFDFATNTFTSLKTIVSGSTGAAGWKQFSEGAIVDDKIYYQCFTDSSDTSQTTIRVFDTTTNTETTQSLGGSLHPLPSIYGITAYQNKLYLQFQTYNTTLHEYEIGVWTVRPIASFAITIVAIIQIGTSLAVLDSSGHIQYYDFVSETLPENSLAVLDGTSRKVQLISTSKQNLPLYFQDAWWYGTNFNEYPTYTGDGTAWTKYKN
ncbi:hypothetical protein [Caproicibacter sp. BJN0012]|uniref:hypothetical protein n=1 Tax=Caproicibacter sp. BJN0012 TaxID=3110227 RepID=UPI002E123B2C